MHSHSRSGFTRGTEGGINRRARRMTDWCSLNDGTRRVSKEKSLLTIFFHFASRSWWPMAHRAVLASAWRVADVCMARSRCSGSRRSGLGPRHPTYCRVFSSKTTETLEKPADENDDRISTTDVATLRNHYATEGWVVVRAVANSALIDALQRDTDSLEQEAKTFTHSRRRNGVFFETQSVSGKKQNPAAKPGLLRKVGAPSKRHGSFRELVGLETIHTIADTVCDMENMKIAVDQVNMKPPNGSGSGFPWHRDFSFLKPKGTYEYQWPFPNPSTHCLPILVLRRDGDYLCRLSVRNYSRNMARKTDTLFYLSKALESFSQFGGVNVVVALDKSHANNGGFEVLGRTHLTEQSDEVVNIMRDSYDGGVDDGFSCVGKGVELVTQSDELGDAKQSGPENVFDETHRVCPNLQPGDAVFFHPKLAHGSLRNNGHERRRIATLWYVGRGEV